MSNKKDKKNDPTSLIEKQFQTQKRQLINAQFTVKHLQEKLAERTAQTKKLNQELEEVKKNSEEKIQQLLLRTSDDEKRLTNQINKITDLEIKATKYESSINSLKEELSAEKQQRFKEVSELKIRMDSEKMKLDIQLKDLHAYMEERESRKVQLEELRQKIEFQKAERVREVADKQREKVQATDKLRDEMLKKIRDMQTSLLSLKKEQLETTTRLTILQNHQLTSELEYQSKQTEKLIFKDEEMQNQIKKLTQELNIHKEVEDELAKRAHFSKGVIKKLNEKVAQLQKELEKMKEQEEENILNHNMMLKSRPFLQEPNKDKETIESLERQLQQTEKKYTDLVSKFQAVQKEKENVVCCLRKYEKSTNDLVKILNVEYQQILNKESISSAISETNEKVMKVNLKEIRDKNVQDWSHEELSFIVKFLLNLLKPYFTRQNLMIPPIRKNIILEDSFEDRTSKSTNRLPKLLDENDDIKMGKKKIQDLPVNIASKIVASNLREWGNTVKPSQNSQLKRKYKISQSYR